MGRKSLNKSKQLVEVMWIDSQTQDGWTHAEHLPKELNLSRTIALLIDETRSFYTLAHTEDQQTGSFNGIITIPKKAVVSKRVLKF